MKLTKEQIENHIKFLNKSETSIFFTTKDKKEAIKYWTKELKRKKWIKLSQF